MANHRLIYRLKATNIISYAWLHREKSKLPASQQRCGLAAENGRKYGGKIRLETVLDRALHVRSDIHILVAILSADDRVLSARLHEC
jgi:hypothetical protein